MKKTILLLAGILLLATGCTLAPRYTKPEAPVPAEWPKGPAYTGTGAAAVPAVAEWKWREFFADEKLQKVVETALDNNRDLRLAVLNVEKVRALYGIQRAELYPSFGLTGSGTKKRVPADLSSSGKSQTVEEYSVNLGVLSWEIDLFGRIRSMKDSALEEYLSTEQARRGAQILLVSEVATAYLTLAVDRENLTLSRSTLESRKAAYDLIRRRYELGLASELDLRRAQTTVDAARADVARYTEMAAQDENTLNLLAGSTIPEDLLPADLAAVTPPAEISPGLSSEVLLARPDILAAEHLLKAANANIGAARAAFFPRISLTATAGTASSELSRLFEAHQGVWSFVPVISMPIFDARTWSAYDASQAEGKIALTKYEKAIQNAFREVADGLAVQGTVGEQVSAQRSLVEATAETYRLSNARYEKGIDSFLGVLDAQRSLYAAQQGLIAVRLKQLANRVLLYAALGGGGN
jgi:multidrug efflux system outer membrane protein